MPLKAWGVHGNCMSVSARHGMLQAGIDACEEVKYGYVSNNSMLHEASGVIMIRRVGGGIPSFYVRHVSNYGVSASPVWSEVKE